MTAEFASKKISLHVSLTNGTIDRWMAVSSRVFLFFHRVTRLDNKIIKILSDHRSLSSSKMGLCCVANLPGFTKFVVIVNNNNNNGQNSDADNLVVILCDAKY